MQELAIYTGLILESSPLYAISVGCMPSIMLKAANMLYYIVTPFQSTSYHNYVISVIVSAAIEEEIMYSLLSWTGLVIPDQWLERLHCSLSRHANINLIQCIPKFRRLKGLDN